jgi:hypothetical protein
MAFDSFEAAIAWMYDEVDDPFVDNVRTAHVGDEAAMAAYDDARDHGCCGFFDADVVVAGRPAMVGCNYGH